MAFDAFMLIKVRGKEILAGESTDAMFPKACEIRQFRFTPSAADSQMDESVDGTDDDTSIESSADVTHASHRTHLKDAKDISGLNGSLKTLEGSLNTLEQRIADHEEKHDQDLKRLSDRTSKLSRAGKARTSWWKAAQEKLERAADSAVASERKSDPKSAAAKRLSVALLKFLDSASPGLLKAYCIAADPKQGGERYAFDSVNIIFRKAGGTNPLLYLRLNLYKVDVTAYSLESGSGTEHPEENLTLSFESFNVEYTSQSAAGTTSAKSKTKIMGWNFEKNNAQVDAGLPAGFGLFD